MPIRLAKPLLALMLLAPLGSCLLGGAAVVGATVGAATALPPPEGNGPYPVDATLQLDFSPPRPVVAAMPPGRDSVRVPDVTRIVGRVHESRGDTLWVAITRLGREGGSATSFAFHREPVAMLLTGEGMRVRVVTRDTTEMSSSIGGGVLFAILALLGFIAYCRAHPGRCYD